MFRKLTSVIKLLRVQHYVKNLFIYLPLFFVGNFTNIDLLILSSIAFIGFSMFASSIYIINDLVDVENDKNHPSKKNRPIAAGKINFFEAILLIFILLLSGSFLINSISFTALQVCFIYFFMNLAYTFKLKQKSIIDVSLISFGFVLRILVGSIVTETPLSNWIIVLTFLLALFLALGKRRDDVLIFIDSGKKMRKSVDGYSLQFIDSSMLILASVIIVSYILYSVSFNSEIRLNSEYLYLSSVFVVFGILRYLQIVFIDKNSGSPTKILLKDQFTIINLILWIISFLFILYF